MDKDYWAEARKAIAAELARGVSAEEIVRSIYIACDKMAEEYMNCQSCHRGRARGDYERNRCSHCGAPAYNESSP